MHIEIQNCFSFWGTPSPRPHTGASPLDPTGDFCHPDPLHRTFPTFCTTFTPLLLLSTYRNYRQRLGFLNLPTLAFRRNRSDMIEVYKLLMGKYDSTLPSIFHRNINSAPPRVISTEIVHISFQVRFMQIQLYG